MRPNDPLLHTAVPGFLPESVLTPSVCNQFQQHALAAYPHECIGYVKDGVYVPLENSSPRPLESASIDPVTMLNLLADGIDALCHSHPDGYDCPSQADMVLQAQMDIPHALVWTNGETCRRPFLYGDCVARPALLGRPYRYNVTHCLALIRDFYDLVMGIELDDFPSDWEWWCNHDPARDGPGLYMENYAKLGFAPIDDNADLQIGDCLLLRAGAKVANHAAVYIGEHLLLQHLGARTAYDASRISTVEPIIRWRQYGRIDKVLRHKGVEA